MDKLSVFSSLQKSIDTLKATGCSSKEKIHHFGLISESIVSVRSGVGSANFQNHLSSAVECLLTFCEEADSGVRMSAEENLNKIVRFCEGNGSIVRVQIDLYHEIKKNGNERSLRISLALFGHYCGAIKQRKGKTFAQNLLPSIYAISKRSETQVLESLSTFVKVFTERLECYMTDGEVLKMTEVFVEDLAAECATKRRCAAQNIDYFIAGSRCPEIYANNAFNRCIEMLLKNQGQNAVLGVLACFRGILPLVLKHSSVEKSIETLDLVLHFLKDGSHSIINAALEVISVIFGNLPAAVKQVLLSQDVDHRKFLLKRKTLKNSVFKINLSESMLSSRKSSTDARMDSLNPRHAGMSFLQVSSTPTKFTPGDDKSLASASDFELDSFRSMEFDNSSNFSPEKDPRSPRSTQPPDTISLKSQKSTDSIGSFINTFLTTSTSAGESVTKFFRKSFDSPVASASVHPPLADQHDDLSLESLASSQISMQSSTADTIRNELLLEVDDRTETVSETLQEAAREDEDEDVTEADEVRAETPTTASIAGAMEDIVNIGDAPVPEDDDTGAPARDLFIGTIHDQSILDYTVRLIASRFLLSGTSCGSLIPDSTVRVSVKAMSLLIVGQCVQLRPEVLLLPLEKDIPREEFDVVEILNLEDAIAEISSEAILEVDEAAGSAEVSEVDGLLEMKEDHFGECTSSTYFEYFSPMSISLDQGLTSLKSKLKLVEENFSTMAMDSQDKLSKELDAILSQSDCSGEVARRNRKELLVVPRVITVDSGDRAGKRLVGEGDQQMLADVMLYYDHSDQTLRGHVLQIVGYFLGVILKKHGSLEKFLEGVDKNAELDKFIKLDALLHVVGKGLLDEIHTVVNQALTAFDQIFAIYCRTRPIGPHPERESIDSEFTFKPKPSENIFNNTKLPTMTPELLINKLLLVFQNKYWLVQCKVCDAIVNLDFALLRAVLGTESARTVQDKCLDQLLLLIKDGDFRVRNHSGERLMGWIENLAKCERGSRVNEGILETFVKEYVTASYAEPIDARRLRKPLDVKLFASSAGPVFYKLSNQLLNLSDRNQLLGIIQFLRLFITKYNPFDLLEVWNEFNLLNVLLSLMSEHTGTALDLTAQSDLLTICSTLMIVTMSSRTISPADNEVIDKFIFHVLKIFNIYQHLFTNVKPVVISREKSDLFIPQKDLQLINCFGYFGNDHFYIKLYGLLRNSFESYKITVNGDVGQKLFDLLRSTISSLWRLLEIKNITTMTNGFKFIEEVLRYLMTFLPYEPEWCVRCTKYLLRFLFTCNFVNRTADVEYFRRSADSLSLHDSDNCREFFDQYYDFHKCKSLTSTTDLGNYIKQFEQMVIACLKIYSKTSVAVQTAILELLCQLLDYSINYQLLDSSNVFVECVLKHVELLETGTIRGSEVLIGRIIKFLILLPHTKERSKVVDIPKIINICDNMLANGLIRDTAIASLQVLAHEIFFLNRAVDQTNLGEHATQKEVILNMMIKFPEEVRCYGAAPTILLVERSTQSGKYEAEILNTLLGVIQEGKLLIEGDRERMIVEQTLDALGKQVLLESNAMQNFLKIFFGLEKNKDIEDVQKMLYYQLILEKVLLNTEETYLMSHVKLFFNKEQTFGVDGSGEALLTSTLNDILCRSIKRSDEVTTSLLKTMTKLRKFPTVFLDAKLEQLLKTEPLESEALHQILPGDQFGRLFATLSPDRRKRFPKLFKTALLLVRFYPAVESPLDLFPRVDVAQLKQIATDDPWFLEQIAYHCTGPSYTKSKNVARMLLEVNSESKLINLLSSADFNARLLREVIETGFDHMLHNFRVDCVLFNPHLNYLKVHPMLKVALIVLVRKLDEINGTPEERWDERTFEYCARSVVGFLESLSRLEHTCLIYVEAKFVDRFIKDNLLKSNFFEPLLIFARNCAKLVRNKIATTCLQNTTILELYLKGIDSTLRQKHLWTELNQNDKFRDDQELYVNLSFDVLKHHLRGSPFLESYRPPEIFSDLIATRYDQVQVYLQAIFIAQYISEREQLECSEEQRSLLETVRTVAIAVLKTDRFYPFAMTPGEVFNCYNLDVDVEPLRLPAVPIDYLYELDTLEVYLKRVSIFGFSSKQQFEELFMSLLVLINREGDPEMINYQEQYELKGMCLRAIVELLLSCYKYPRIGFGDGKFHHVPRNPAIKCSSVGLKKLHGIQLLIPLNSVFYQSNLERNLLVTCTDELCAGGDNAIGTQTFGCNQFSIQYSWHAMEGLVNESLVARNLRYFIERANLDVLSSVQLIYDIFGQLMEDFFSLVLPHLVKFCEICENRDQIRQLYTLVLALQERVPMEDTLSQQHIIYLLCKMAALLVPSMAELTHLCTIIPTYLKSTQLYIRDATLAGLICLLECLVTSNTTMGGLSEELQLLRNVIVNYIVKHGIIDESSTAFSDVHTKLVWTLNFYLIENTSRFVTDCNLLSNSVISANNILKRTTNLEIYLCILNGLERVILTNTAPRPLLEKIEKLALDLVKLDNEMFSLAALKLLVACIYHGSAEQLENTERSNGIVQDEPEIIIQQIEKIEILFTKIRTTTPQGARIFGEVLCQLIRDLLPPNEILTKVFKELMLNQPNPDIIATVTHQVFRSAIDSSYLTLLQEWLLCSLPNFLSFPQINKSVWCLTVIFLSASLNQHLLKLFPEVLSLPSYQQLNEREINNFILAARDFYRKLEPPQRAKFREVFEQSDSFVYQNLLQCLTLNEQRLT
ncbi:hypothetical protein pipiens_004323 [Culex pipiens pipiens]|uniref:Huntingtin n=1 Tax=Culex pipiens pipiens TaxID=38569 RepID=A0ABD1CJY6_CULPP